MRLPDLQQKRMVEFAHSIGVPVATHEIYPAAFVGVDNTEHTSATSRRGYSPKMATLQRSYEDVIQLFGKSGRIFCPMMFGAARAAVRGGAGPEERSALQAVSGVDAAAGRRSMANLPRPNLRRRSAGGNGKMVMDVMHAGGLIVAGTDTPNAINLHGEIDGLRRWPA